MVQLVQTGILVRLDVTPRFWKGVPWRRAARRARSAVLAEMFEVLQEMSSGELHISADLIIMDVHVPLDVSLDELNKRRRAIVARFDAMFTPEKPQ